MSEDLIERALASADDTDEVVMGNGVLGETGRLFRRLFGDAGGVVIADGNTWAVAGEQVTASLRAAGVELAEPYVFPAHPSVYAKYENVELLREFLAPLDVNAVVIGSGTLNDLVKKASDELGRRYLVVCTAASMDGYAAFGASISVDGFKTTLSCRAPQGLVVDLPTLAAAPQRCTATGVGDLIEKIPAGADWILADALGIEPINEYVWDMVQGPLRGSLADPEAIGNGDKKAIEGLMEGNLMSGLAMQAGQSSRSASGAGHQFSHTWEMEGHGLDWEPPLSHGFKVGIGTIASCAIWEEFLAMEAEDFDVDRALAAVKTPEQVESEVRAALKPRMQDEAVRHSLKKRTEGEELVARIELLKEKWPELRERLRAQLMAPGEVMDRLKTVGAPYHPELIEIDWDRFRQTHFKAQMIRDRYTVLDILVDLGVYGDVVERLFSPEGFWGRHRHPSA